ncbi:MAG TPA: hypothetical protein VKZ96_01375 [Thermomicrobiales bacterium]|nr:hypothetical protein [Thermomicrobiales bacterium]
MYMRRQRTGRQLLISIATGVATVTVLAILVGTLERTPLMAATLAMTLLGLTGIWIFDSEEEWSWPADAADYLTIVGLIGFWSAVSDEILSWAVALVFYWGLATLVRRASRARRA